jgi:hypothetical protein
MRTPARWIVFALTIVSVAPYPQIRYGSRTVGVALDVAVLDNGWQRHGTTCGCEGMREV